MLRVIAFVVATGLAACQLCTEETASRALAQQPLGARCHTDGECAAGVGCIEDLCTRRCDLDESCPAGTHCVLTGLCLPACDLDADCLLGATAARCSHATSPAYCFPVSCNSDAVCPTGSRCVEASLAYGITWNEVCATGWCQR